jgi:hypothetical protein
MNIKGIKGLTVVDIQNEVDAGAKFVRFSYCISLVLITFRQTSAVYFIRKDGNAFVKSLPYTLLSFLLGWWGLPWGIIYTPACIFANIRGGKDVTGDMMAILHRYTHGHVFDFEQTEILTQQN